MSKLNIDKLIEQTIKTDSFKEALLHQMAFQVADSYHYDDIEGRLIKPAIRQIIQKEAEKIVKDYLDNYFEANSIEQLTRKYVEQLLKENITNVFAQTNKQ